MRLIHVYLVVYCVLVIGAGLALWQAGVLARLPGTTVALVGIGALLLGVLLAVTATNPTRT
jgi:hypothetical protein